MRVLVVDGSAVIRMGLVRRLEADAGIEVTAVRADAAMVEAAVGFRRPAAAIAVGAMDGAVATALKRAGVPLFSLPESTRDAVRSGDAAGAVAASTLRHAIRKLVRELRCAEFSSAPPNLPKDAVVGIDDYLPTVRLRRLPDQGRVICVGSSTGGTRALESIFTSLSPDVPGLVVVQHMPPGFTRQFSERLDSISPLEVREAQDGMLVVPGRAIIAPGGRQLHLTRGADGYRVEVRDGPRVHRHRPSVDVLFRSALNVAGPDTIGVLLTGMGDDGARGLAELRQAGAFTIAQDEASCVVYGMPKRAVELGGASRVLPLDDIPTTLWSHTRGSDLGDVPRPRRVPAPAAHLPGTSRVAVRVPRGSRSE